jgi:hypothetical protein
MMLRRVLVKHVRIDDDRAFQSMPLYADLKQHLWRRRAHVRVLQPGQHWPRSQLLNLVHWGDGGGDVLLAERMPADVLCHMAWHSVCEQTLGRAQTARAMLLGESVASAFDAYMIGFFLRRARMPASLQAHVEELMDDAASVASVKEVRGMLQCFAQDPAAAFGQLQHLLWRASLALLQARSASAAASSLARLDEHPFAMLLPHYALSTWVLYAKAYGTDNAQQGAHVMRLHRTLQKPGHALVRLSSLI